MKKLLINVLRPWALFASGLTLLIAAPPALADMAWQSSIVATVKVDGKEQVVQNTSQTMSLKDNVLRVDDPATGSAQFYNFQNNSSLMVDLRGKIFISMDLSDVIASAGRSLQEIRKDLPQREQALAGMTGDQRDLMAAQIEAQKAKFEMWDPRRGYKVRPTSETAEVLGHRCHKFEGLSGDTVFQEIWVADDIQPDPAFRHWFTAYMNRIQPGNYAYLSQIQGFPVRVVSHYGPVTVTAECTSVSTSVLPADAFTLPDDLHESPLVNRQPPDQKH